MTGIPADVISMANMEDMNVIISDLKSLLVTSFKTTLASKLDAREVGGSTYAQSKDIANGMVKWSPNYGQQFGASWTNICAPKPSVIKIHQQLIIKVGKGRLHGEHATTKCTQKGCSKDIIYARKKGEVECFPPHNIIKKMVAFL